MSAPVAAGTVRVLLFARYAELLGTDSLTLPASEAGTIGAVLDHLRALPHGDLLPPRPLVAVNLIQAQSDQPLSPGDEVAVLPPLAGG